jgi:hypothetical protein
MIISLPHAFKKSSLLTINTPELILSTKTRIQTMNCSTSTGAGGNTTMHGQQDSSSLPPLLTAAAAAASLPPIPRRRRTMKIPLHLLPPHLRSIPGSEVVLFNDSSNSIAQNYASQERPAGNPPHHHQQQHTAVMRIIDRTLIIIQQDIAEDEKDDFLLEALSPSSPPDYGTSGTSTSPAPAERKITDDGSSRPRSRLLGFFAAAV